MKICAIIPSFNEEKTIGWLVQDVRLRGFDVIVIDDGSRDQTARLAHQNGAEVLINPVNLGKGASLRKIFEMIKSRPYDAVITMDGDGQHLPADIAPFIASFEYTKAGMIVGNRMHRPKGMPLVRWFTNKFMSWILSCMCGQKIPDSQCGFRLINMEALRRMSLNTEKFEIESEMLLETAQLGYLIESVPITTIYEGQASAIHPVKDTLRFIRFVSRKR